MALKELFLSLGMEIDDKPLKEAEKGLDSFIHKAKELGEVILGGVVVEKFKEFVEGQVEAGVALKRQSEILGISTDNLQKFTLAAKEAGVSSEDAATGLRFLNKNIGEAILNGGEAGKEFAKLGINLKDGEGKTKDVTEVAALLADKLQGMHSQAERTTVAMKLLGRGGANLLPMFQEGGKGIEEAVKDFEELGGGISEDFTKQAHEAERQTVRFQFALTSLKSRIAQAVMPAFEGIFKFMTKWVVKLIDLNKKTNFVKTALIALGTGAAFFALKKLLGVFGELGGGGGVMGVLKGLLKFGFIGAIIFGLYLVFDDLFKLMTGGKSEIGELADQLYGVGTSQKIVEALREAWGDLVEFWDASKPIVIDLAKAIGFTLVEAAYGLVTVGKLIGHAFTFAYEAIAGSISEADKSIDDMKKDLTDFSNFHNKLVDFATGNKNEATAPSVQKPLGPAFFGAGNMNNKVEINVTSTGDPDQTASKVGKAVGRTMQSFTRENNKAYAAFGGSDKGS